MIASLLCVLLNIVPAGEPVMVYVSPSGNDANTGDSPAQALASPASARNRVKVLRGEIGDRPVRVEFAGGIYRLPDTLIFAPEDGGTETAPVTYAAAEGAKPVFSGGEVLPAWRGGELDGKAVWVTQIPAGVLTSSGPIRELWLNGKRRPIARHPNFGYLRMEGPHGAEHNAQWSQGTNAFIFKPADIAMWDKLEPGAEVVTFTRWVDTHLVLAGVDREKRVATFTRKNMFLLQPDDLYVMENSRALLDEPGEWWADGATLYYLPKAGEVMEKCEAVVPRLETLLILAGNIEAETPVQHLTFEGLTFSHARWWFAGDFKSTWPSEGIVGFTQAANGVPGAVLLNGASRCAFNRCEISHVAGYGLELRRGCTDNTISRCTILDLGAGGVRIGELAIPGKPQHATGGTRLEDCTITDGGHTHHQAIGLWIGQSENNVISHNRISRFDYSGISIGWTWGYGPATAGGNIVEYNEVFDLGLHARNAEPPLGDMAGIYTLGKQTGTRIDHNFFHDISGHSIAWGIYFDEGSAGISATNNVVLRTTHGGFHQHYGRDNIVSNNIFAFGRDAQVWRTRREDHTSFTFERNIVIGDNDRWFAGDWTSGLVLRKNLYWRVAGAVPFPGGDFESWQKDGRDEGSFVADPQLGAASRVWNPEGIVGAGSAAKEIGFEAIDLSGIGPRK